jgi:multiple sugar transport system substrate-binding protein
MEHAWMSAVLPERVRRHLLSYGFFAEHLVIADAGHYGDATQCRSTPDSPKLSLLEVYVRGVLMERPASLDRRRFLARAGLVGAALAVPSLAACRTEASKTRSAPPQASNATVPKKLLDEAKEFEGQTTRTLSTRQYFDKANTAVDNILQTFAKDTKTTVKNATFNADEGNFVAKQQAAVRAGNVADMASVDAGRFVSQMHELDLIEDVTDVVDELVAALGPAGGTAEYSLVIDGKWWGIPFYTMGSGWFARKDWLEEKGIAYDDLKTYEDARDAALEISDPDNQRYGWGLTVNRGGDANSLVEGMINAWGGGVSDDAGEKVVFNSAETIEAVRFLAEIYTSDKYKPMLPPGVMSWTDTGNNEAYLAGVTGFTLNSYSIYAEAMTTGNAVHPVTWTFPGFAGPATDISLTTAGAMAFVIFKGAKNPDLAKVVAKYLASGDGLLPLAKDAGALVYPAYEKVWNSDPFYLEGDPIFKPTYELATKELPIEVSTGYHYPQDASPGRGAVGQAYILTDMMGEIIQKDVKVETAVENAHKRMVQAFEQLGFKQ